MHTYIHTGVIATPLWRNTGSILRSLFLPFIKDKTVPQVGNMCVRSRVRVRVCVHTCICIHAKIIHTYVHAYTQGTATTLQSIHTLCLCTYMLLHTYINMYMHTRRAPPRLFTLAWPKISSTYTNVHGQWWFSLRLVYSVCVCHAIISLYACLANDLKYLHKCTCIYIPSPPATQVTTRRTKYSGRCVRYCICVGGGERVGWKRPVNSYVYVCVYACMYVCMYDIHTCIHT